MVKKVITNPDCSEESSPDCIPVTLLKKWGPKNSNTSIDLLNMCLKKSDFVAIGKLHMSSVFKKCWGGCLNIITRPVHHSERKLLSSNFEDSFGSFGLTMDLLTVAAYRIARVFNVSGTTPNVALDISSACAMVWHVGLLHKRESYGI